MVTDVTGGDHEDDVFGDVGGMIADALEVARDQDEVERGLDRGRVLEHVGEELPEDLRLERVQRVVLVQDILRELLNPLTNDGLDAELTPFPPSTRGERAAAERPPAARPS